MTMALHWTKATLVVSLGLLAAGCTKSDKVDSTPQQYAFPGVGDYCTGLAKAKCSTGVVGLCGVQQDTCVAALQANNDCNVPTTGNYRPTAGEACINATKTAYDDGSLTPDEVASMQKACAVVFGGDGESGATCSSLLDCNLDGNYECIIKGSPPAGKCGKPETVKAGFDCGGDNQVCETGFYCDASKGNICRNRGAVGTVCDSFSLCLEDLACVSNMCSAKLAPGDPCTAGSTDQCGSNSMCWTSGMSDAGFTYSCLTKVTFSAFDPFCTKTKP